MMIEAGLLALEIALLVSLTHVAINLIRFFRCLNPTLRSDNFLTTTVFLLIALSFAALLQAYLTDDFSVANVAQNSRLCDDCIRIFGMDR